MRRHPLKKKKKGGKLSKKERKRMKQTKANICDKCGSAIPKKRKQREVPEDRKCAGFTKANEPCKSITAKGFKYCPAHLDVQWKKEHMERRMDKMRHKPDVVAEPVVFTFTEAPSVVEPEAEKAKDEPMVAAAEPVVEEVVTEPIKEVATEPIKEVVMETEPAKEVVAEPIKEVAMETEPAKEVVAEPVKEVVMETEPAKEAAVEPAKEAAEVQP